MMKLLELFHDKASGTCWNQLGDNIPTGLLIIPAGTVYKYQLSQALLYHYYILLKGRFEGVSAGQLFGFLSALLK
jgi:hypothetical protein